MKNKCIVVVYLIFICLTVVNFSFKNYLLSMVFLWGGFFLLSGKMLESLWLAWMGTMLFNKPAYVMSVPDRAIGMNYSYALVFSDLFLILMILYLKYKKNKSDYVWSQKDVCLLLVTLLSVVAIWLAPDDNRFAWYGLVLWVKYIVVFYVAIMVFKDEENIWSTLLIITVFSIFNVLLVVTQKVNGGILGWEVERYFSINLVREIPNLYRPVGTVGDPNLMSSILLITLPLTSWWLEKNKKWKKYQVIFWVISGMAIFLMASRFVWLLLAIMIALVYRNNMINFRISKWWYLGLIGLLPFAVMRWQTLGESGSLAFRWSHFQMTAELLMKRPWGIGWDMFRYDIARNYLPISYFNDPAPQHNLLLEVFSGSGIVGGLIYIWWWILIFKDLFKGKIFWLKLAIGFYFLVCQVYPSLFSTIKTNLFWVLLAIFYWTEEDYH